jgi:acyl carrier protein
MDPIRLIETFLQDQVFTRGERPVITADTNLIEAGLLDSLAIVRLCQFLATEFNVLVRGNEVIPDNFKSLSAMQQFIESRS